MNFTSLMRQRNKPGSRHGMTIVELIVALAIVVMLAGMVVAFWPGVQDQQRAADGATLFEGWLRQAKVRAFQNKKAAGLRLFINAPSATNAFPNLVTQCQYIDQPDDLYIQGYNVTLTGTMIGFGTPATALAAGGAVATVSTPPGSFLPLPFISFSGGGSGAQAVPVVNAVNQITSVNVTSPGSGYSPTTTVNFTVDFYQGQGQQSDPSLWAVQGSQNTVPGTATNVTISGDHLEVNGSGLVHQIVSVLPNLTNSNLGSTLSLQPTITATVSAVTASANVVTLTSVVGNLSLGCYLDLVAASNPGTLLATMQVVNLTPSAGGVNATVAVVPGSPGNLLTLSGSSGLLALSHGISITNGASGATFRIIRAPRIAGDEQLQLPASIVVDLNTNLPPNSQFPQYNIINSNATFANMLPMTSGAAYFDILFSPAGTLVTPGISTDFVALWVRNTNGNDPFQLGPTIIAVWTRSGLIAASPPNDSGSDPYLFVRLGRGQ